MRIVATFTLLLLPFLFNYINASTIQIENNCSYTVWAAASPGGGRRLDQGRTWTLNWQSGTRPARVWGRTNCSFNAMGKGQCRTGDCNGVLNCTGWGKSPQTLAEYAEFSNTDFYDISLVDGFNIPIEFRPVTTSGGTCQPISCKGDINGQCPAPLKVPGGCNDPCNVFNTEEYCCTRTPCAPSNYSRFFKEKCPQAYSFPQDDAANTACPAGTNFKVVFCPLGSKAESLSFELRGGVMI
ncbi:osmotin-like protein OSML13 [Lycium ferocissimum]|uniref:osmotin-like protein OSML13 n=1 Tax=Lycium ferocissimum TaxID=112874 RepID=UPI002814E2C6|nr:osmotin-like protein OSML13 [Lycium ferocissimum]